jgi:hypothetical protein
VLPVLIAGFLRKNQIEKLIRVATSQGVPKIYLSLDGPRNREDDLIQKEIISMIEILRREIPIKIDARRLTLNVGAGAAIISAVDWFFEQESRGIVLEDDLSPDPSFFIGASRFLERTDVDPRVLMFSGTNVFKSDKREILLLRYPVVWGWATTQEKWVIIRTLIFSPLQELSISKLGVNYFYWRVGKRRALRGQTQVWDVPLAGAMLSQEYYCALSPTNLITNKGDDSFASNTKENGWPLNLAIEVADVNLNEIPVSAEAIAEREQIMRKNVFKIGLKFIASSFFWNFCDFIRWRSHDGTELAKTLSTVEWKYV